MCNEVQYLMLYITHLPRGYFHTKNEMIMVNIVEITEHTQIRLQTDGQMDRRIVKVKTIPHNYILQGV